MVGITYTCDLILSSLDKRDKSSVVVALVVSLLVKVN